MSEKQQSSRPLRSHDREHILVSLISLGCAKNLVDSEVILGNLGESGLAITPRHEDADVILINTCGFIQSAREESIQAIREICRLKQESPTPKKVVVVGCLGQRYGEKLREEVPGIDAVVGLGEYDGVGPLIRDLVDAPDGQSILRVGDPNKACNAEVGRFRLTPSHYAYVKISEGCDNPCTFCAIPAIRGAFRSKPIPAILEEVRELVGTGTKEINLISQDTTSYGVDLTGRLELPSLLEKLDRVPGLEWIRVLYAYPAFLTDEMMAAMASLGKVVKYLDLPLQHISDKMLRRMGRRLDGARTRSLLEKLRGRIPGIYLRTTFLVGFPGEDEREFGLLRDFVRDFRFERLGVFAFSEEEGTAAATFAGRVPTEVRARRAEEILLVQRENAFRHNRGRKGESVRVLVDEVRAGRKGRPPMLRARSAGEAPEIDPCVLVHAEPACGVPSTAKGPLPAGGAAPGDFLLVTITGSRGYDLLSSPAKTASKGGALPLS